MVNSWVTLLLQTTLTTTRADGVENPLWKPGDNHRDQECRGPPSFWLYVAPAEE